MFSLGFGHAVDYFYILMIFEIFCALVITKSRQEKSPWGRKLRVLRGGRWEEINFLKETFICSPTVCTGHNWAIHFLHTKTPTIILSTFLWLQVFFFQTSLKILSKMLTKIPLLSCFRESEDLKYKHNAKTICNQRISNKHPSVCCMRIWCCLRE